MPARDEAERLPQLVASLAAQRDGAGRPLAPGAFEVVVLLNNCRDGSREALERAGRAHPGLRLHAVEVELAPPEAHVGRARQFVLDAACARFAALGRGGLILTTDADTRVPPDWVASAQAEVDAGADLVGGRVTLDPAERAALPPAVRRMFLLDIGYRRALEEVCALYAPCAWDPFPRHHQHFGACLAVTAAAYRRAGGLPPVPASEDVALVRAVEAVGGRVRHSYRFRAATSARVVGRASGGLADALGWWTGQAEAGAGVRVESAAAAERRLACLGRFVREHPSRPAPPELTHPPEPPPDEDADAIERVLRDLRVAAARLRALSLDNRLALPAPPPRTLTLAA
ncbi:glycosyltransferase [Rubrivirga litoralis]|uniref:Glycosyltransferase family A protein n=1 Tax=Rubrivirga litoralis TaxID=3075598 RepID=A0ABU3BQD4_9BACT|nr:glycosyltransferase family A protein [Rubrivirga sp. F394]MDT0631493.1 glycosyltransferase family A protein [Rubrivirga sp. F394]